MHELPEPTHRAGLPGRVAWLACLAILLILGIANATAAQGDSSSSAATAEPDLQLGEEEGWTEEECIEETEELEVDAEEAEETCEELDESEANATGACPLRSAHGHAAASHGRLKVTVGYMSSEPVAAKIQIQGGAHAETYKRHLGRSGVLRFTEKLGERHGNRVVILIQPTAAPKCSVRRLVLSLPG